MKNKPLKINWKSEWAQEKKIILMQNEYNYNKILHLSKCSKRIQNSEKQ
jgi:hypothetical protein